MVQAGDQLLRHWAARLLELLWLTAAVALPLAVNPWSAGAFELPKAVLLRTLVLLMALAALVHAAESPSIGWRRQSRSPLLWPGVVLALVLALATAFSTNPRASLWGSYERQQGLITLACYLALAVLTAAHLHTRAQVRRLWAAIVWGSAPVVAYGLLQAAHLDPLAWRTDAASPVLSTIGRANFLGSYLVLVAPLTLGRALVARRRPAYVLLLAAQLACLALTQARGAYAGLGVAAVAFGLAWAAATRDRRPAIAVLALAVAGLGTLGLLNLPDGPLTSLAGLPGLDRLATLADTQAGSTAARLTIWRAALPLIARRPWLGYGPETLRTVFARVFPPQLVYYQGRGVAVDRAHNLWLDLALSAGLAGVLAFACLLAACGRQAWRGLRCAADRWRQALWAALIAAIVGHLADLQFGFDLTASAAVFWLLVGMAWDPSPPAPSPTAREMGEGCTPAPLGGRGRDPAAPEAEPASQHPGEGSLRHLLPYLPPAAVLLALLCLSSARPLLADVAHWRSLQAGRAPRERLAAAAQAVRLWPLEPEYRLGLSAALLAAGRPVEAEGQLAAAESLSPSDPHILTARGELYARWGELEPARLPLAEAAYREALDLAPDVAMIHTALGLVLARQGRLGEAVAELERAVDLDATDGVAFAHLAELYRSLGREAKAAWAQREAERWGDSDGV